MVITVKTHPRAKKEKIVRHDVSHYEVWVSAPPEKGKANRAVIEKLGEYLDLPGWRLTLISGETSRNKKINIDEG